MSEPTSTYQSKIDRFKAEESRFRKKVQLIGNIRVVTALFTLICLWQSIDTGQSGWIIGGAALLLLFVALVRLYVKTQNKKTYFQRLKEINQQELAGLNGDLSSFKTGEKYIKPQHAFSYDLDVFGYSSLFQLINRTVCPSAEQLLVERLSSIPDKVDTVLQRRGAINELAPLVDFRQSFIAQGSDVNEEESATAELVQWAVSSKSDLNNAFFKVCRYALPIIACGLLLLAMFNVIPYLYWTIVFLLNLSFTGLFLRKINRFHAQISEKYRLLDTFSLLFRLIDQQQFKHKLLQDISRDSNKANLAIKKLSGSVGFFDQRMNFMIGAVLNGFFLSDFHCIATLDKWKELHRQALPNWLNDLFLMDELCSFANFTYNHPHYTEAHFTDELVFSTEEMGHPLIAAQECVTNSLHLDGEKVVILTGANMSGKSTFLRTIGVNLLLAYCGAPVFAKKLNCSLAKIATSMRITDSLDEHTSYFYAELKRLATIMESLRKGDRLVILLDEILKGTNSADKLHGSIGLVKEFVKHDCLSIIATHDLHLGKMEEECPNKVSNYCFESSLKNDELSFDYKIRQGLAKNKNATFLMQKSGLIQE